MIFEKITTIPTSDELIDKAFKRASRAMSGKKITGRDTARQAHESMILTSGNILSDNLSNIVRHFPNFDDLHPFYYDLANVMVGIDKLRLALGKIDWASSKIHGMAREHVGMIRRSQEPTLVRKKFFGRVGSIMKSINKDLVFLSDARDKLKELPSVEDEPTIVVAGYPNIGKSSFVSMATGAKPEIASYPFTTKGVSIGHFMIGPDRYQVIDTPGLLDRPMSERNEIELQAISALTNLEAVVLFIIDASESCGYEIQDQKSMLEDVRDAFELPFLVVANKSDLPQFRELDFVDMKMSTATGEGVQEVMNKLVEMMDQVKIEDV